MESPAGLRFEKGIKQATVLSTRATINSLLERVMKTNVKNVFAGLCLATLLAGCATVESAYKSASDAVSGWFKSDEKKDQKK